MPRSLRGLLAARLDRLGSAKRIAQAAAVCGRTFSYAMLEALVGAEAGAPGLDAGLARLLDAEILFQRGPLLRAAFTWKHALLREAAYESLPDRERRRLHALAARALPDLDPAAVTSRPELLARHWAEAGRPDQAFGWWRQAGLRALDRCAYVEARHDLECAIDAVHRTASTAEERRQRKLELRLALTSLEMDTTDRARAKPAAACGAPRPSVAAPSKVTSWFTPCSWRRASDSLAASCARRCGWSTVSSSSATGFGIPFYALQSSLRPATCSVAWAGSTVPRAILDRSAEAYALATVRPAGWLTVVPLVNVYYARATIAFIRGRLTECRAQVDAGIADPDVLGHPFSQALIRVYCAPIALLAGDRDWLVELLSFGERQAAAVESGFLVHLAKVLQPLAEPTLSPSDREEKVQAALRDSEQIGFRLCRSIALAELAALQSGAGKREQALQTIDEATMEATRRMDRAFLPEILRRRAELLATWGREGGSAGRPAQEPAPGSSRRGVRARASRRAQPDALAHRSRALRCRAPIAALGPRPPAGRGRRA